jgi:hypothetical protein
MRIIVALVSIVMASASLADGKKIAVPNDPAAEYVLLHKNGERAHRIAITKRTALTGVVYTKREYNCDSETVRFISSSGVSTEALEQAKVRFGEMAIHDRTVGQDLAVEACSEG